MSPQTSPASFTAADLHYPDHLPVTGERDRIMEALDAHQVVVVAGETGSGKTTQLPKMLLERGAHTEGLIGHTQPRRLAARTVAERLAEELHTNIGDVVGYQVRFTAEVGENTAVKLMTDGILLAEIQRDPQLRKYSAIIIDEAHERSLNIDVILGYLKRILPQRPDLKVIVTSATIDPERFSEHFSDAPIIEVSGRTYPVEIRYRPQGLRPEPSWDDDGDSAAPSSGSAQDEDRDELDAISDAVLELADEPDGDILIFFPGEREIRDAAEALGQTVTTHRKLKDAEILPLFGRLSLQEQKRVFNPGGKRRIVLATNVAETSLTVPGIKYVIDTGTARISRYSTRTKVQRLPIEAISQASARQRAGRCGRTSDGICIRLYSEEDFENRPEFTDPEILRTSLASVLLQMSSMGITSKPQELLDFPFVQKPDAKAVNDAVRLLNELGALQRSGRVTQTGRALAQLPVDPRLGRMMVEASRRECLTEITVLVAGLSIQDVRERPADHRDRADQLHGRFRDDVSDFSAMLNLWRYLQEKQEELSSSQFRKLCRAEHLNWLRIREWQDLVSQLGELGQQAKLSKRRVRPKDAVDPVGSHEAVHISLLSGLLSHIGLYSQRTREYQGARGTRFAIFPGSGLFKKNPDLVMASELVETSRLWARTVAAVRPAWAEELGADLLKRSYSEPTWSASRGAAVATERATLFGVPIVADRTVLYASVDPEFARHEFIRHALIEGDWNTRHHFDKRNRERFSQIEELEERTRRKNLRAADYHLEDFFDQRLPASITSQRAFDVWWKKQRHDTPELLDIPDSTLVTPEAEQVDLEAYPEFWDHDGLRLDLTYAYEAGVTVRVPIVFLHQMEAHRFDWFIPGRRTEMLTALIRALPKQMRKNFVPAPDVAAQAYKKLETDYLPGVDPFYPALARTLRQMRGVVLEADLFDAAALPEHLRFTFAVVSDKGRVLDTSADLAELQIRFGSENQKAVQRSVSPPVPGRDSGGAVPTNNPAPQARRSDRDPGSTTGKDSARGAASSNAGAGALSAARNQRQWTFGDIPAEVMTTVQGRQITGYPALTADDDGVHVTVLTAGQEQQRVHRGGVIRLLKHVLPSPQRYVVDHLTNQERVAFGQFADVETIVSQCTIAALDHLVPASLPFTEEAFRGLSNEVRADLIETVLQLTGWVATALTRAAQLRSQFQGNRSAALKPAVSDMQAQLDHLVHAQFISAAGFDALRSIPRYLEAMDIRWQRLQQGQGVAKDTTDMQQVQELEDEYDAAVEQVPAQRPVPPELTSITWLIEELRVGLFAQHLGTAQTVSAKRIRRALKQAPRL